MTTILARCGTAAALALTLSAASLVAQTGQAAVDPTTVPALKAEFDRAAKLGVPTEPLIATARRGYLMSTQPARIVTAVHGLALRMVAAREALSPVVNDAEVEAGASAMQIGVTTPVLKSLRAAQRTRSLAVPIGVLQELVAGGVELDKASATVTAMIKKHATDGQILAVGKDVQGDIGVGVAPSAALDVRSRGVLSLPQAGIPAGAAAAPNRR